MSNQRFGITQLKITWDSSLLDQKYNVTPEVKRIIREIAGDIEKGEQRTIDKLKEYIERYPDVPQFKNFLERTYASAGMTDKAWEMTKRTVREHPEYLYGKLNFANVLIEQGEPERVPDIIGEEMNLASLYPEREEVHVGEVLSFFNTCMRYYLAIDDRESAERCLEIMEEVAPDERITQEATDYWLQSFRQRAEQRFREEQAFRRNVTSRSYDVSVQTDEPPSFNHPKVNWLYEHDLQIERERIQKLLDLPRETLVEDLETVIEDSIRRYEYFQMMDADQGYWDERRFSFPIHALLLLSELQAEESLEKVLRLLRQGEELLDFWFENLFNEIMWSVLLKIGSNKLDRLADFVKEPNNYTFARSVMGDAVSQLALHKPDRREAAIEWFGELFRFFLDNIDDERIIDTEVISLFIWQVTDLNGIELQEQIEDLYEEDVVEIGMVGTCEEVKSDMKRDAYVGGKLLPLNDIWGEYDKLDDMQNGDFWPDPFDQFPEDEDLTPPPPGNLPFSSLGQSSFDPSGNGNQPFESADEPGRNDPCPCGSGKKYKHCCME